ncbi:MCE family protein [Nocardioides sp. BGMRC 2183]|nr:MCE family protein [Nocardioides sp. BGMRC 2183]
MSRRTPLNERDPFKVGLIALLIGGLIAGAVVLFSVTSFGTTTYTAELEHTAGLRTGEEVQVHGVPKGEVTDIAIEDEHVLVTFTVDSDIELGARSRATVKVATLLGTHYLEIDPQGSAALAEDRIPLERTSVPYNLQDVLEKSAESLDELDPQVLAEALTAMSDTLGASKEEIGPALQGVARLSEMVSRRSDEVGALLEAGATVTEQLSDSSEDIVALMKQTTLVVTEVTARRQAIHRLLVETRELSRALTAVVRATNGKVNPALTDLNEVLTTLNQEDKQLTELLRTMAPALRYVANATGSGPYLGLYLDPPAIPADDWGLR